MTRIGIVGGGPGGLFAAQMLEEFCGGLCEITLFEAGPRVGGKILTERFRTAPVMYEAGVAEIYDYSHFGPDPLKQLIKKLGLETVKMVGPTVILGDAILTNNRDIRSHFGAKTLKALQNFHQLCKEMCTPDDYYEGHWQDDNQNPWAHKTFREVLDEIPDETARKYIEVASRSDVATEPHLTSALNGLKNVLMDDPRYLRLYSIVGGIGRLTEEVAKQIKSPIVLDSPVLKVAKYDAGYRLTTRKNGQIAEHEFDMVILALPNYWLQRLEWGSRDLRLAMQQHLAHYDRPAHYLRMSVLFKEPFWRSQIPGAYFMTDAFGGSCVYDEGARHRCEPFGVLNWLLAGNDAMALSNLDDDRLIEMALDSLPESLFKSSLRPTGGKGAGVRELFVEGRVHRWVGTINGMPGGQPTHEIRQRHLVDPHGHPHLYVTGDYLFDSTLNGVYDSADFVTDMILTELRKRKYRGLLAVDAETPSVPAVCNGQANGKHTSNGELSAAYHDCYNGEVSYEESYQECFNAEWTVKLIDAVWGRRPPYRLLDCGSASGLTLEAFAGAGIDAWGIENSAYIHAKTPAKWKNRNLLGDVRKLPFPDNHFDFVYDTSLCYVPTEDLDQAVRELHRVCKHGIFFGGVTADMTLEVIEDYNLFKGVRSLFTLWEWAEIFMRNGFRPGATDPKVLAKVWQIESEIDEDDWYWYADQDSMRYCFYTKSAPDHLAAPGGAAILNGHVSRDYHDYYDGERSYAESWKDCFCEHYTADLIRAIWGCRPPYTLLDCGSASGLTLEAFAKIGIDAWGVENSAYIHAQTPPAWRKRNLLADVRELPFPDRSFDFVYDTSLCHVPSQDLDRAIGELARVCRVGVFFGTFAADMPVAEAFDIHDGVHSLLSLAEWSKRMQRHDFHLATRDPRRLARAWKIEVAANAKRQMLPWYPDAQAMRYCFYSRPGVRPKAAKKKRGSSGLTRSR